MDQLLQWLVGAVVWLVANVVYLDMKRQGEHGLLRWVAFWMGTPTTWATLLLVREGSQPKVRGAPDDDAHLLEEIRRDRMLRDGGGLLPTDGGTRPPEEHDSTRSSGQGPGEHHP